MPWASLENGLLVRGLQEDVTAAARPALIAIVAAAAVLLLIACVNVANLLLARSRRRRAEFALRSALGAEGRRLVRQLLTESVMLAMIGGALAFFVAQLGVGALIALSPPGLPSADLIRVDAAAFVFGLVVTTIVGVTVGLMPALGASRADVRGGMQTASRTVAGGRGAARGALVVSEVALALVLLVGAGLLLRSLDRLFAVSPGVQAERVLTMQVVDAADRNRTDQERLDFYDQVVTAVRNVPGVTGAAFTSQLPLSGDLDAYGYKFAAFPEREPGEDGAAMRYSVTADYFEVMGIPLLRGRLLDATDRADAPGSFLISESLARQTFGDADPIGQRVRFGPESDGTRPWGTVVGVVGDVKQQSLASQNTAAFYVPSAQWRWVDPVQSLVVRTSGDAAALTNAVRRAVWSVDRNKPITRVATMEQLIWRTGSDRRFASVIYGTFAIAALLLAAVGLYGVISGLVAERTREIRHPRRARRHARRDRARRPGERARVHRDRSRDRRGRRVRDEPAARDPAVRNLARRPGDLRGRDRAARRRRCPGVLGSRASRGGGGPGGHAPRRVRWGPEASRLRAASKRRLHPVHMGHFWNELKVTVRTLARSRGFATVIVVTLAIALALQASVIAVVNAYLVRGLPYPAADRLFGVRYARPGEDPPENLSAVDWASLSGVIEHPIAWDLDVFYLLGGEYPEAAPGTWVTLDFMLGFGVRPAFGRGLVAADFEVGRPQVALISHALWRDRFAGDSGAIGRTMQAYVSDRPRDPETFTIVGVLPDAFWHLNPYTQLLTPLRAPTYPYLVRLRPDVPPTVAAERITAAVRAALPGVPDGWQVQLQSTEAAYATAVKPMLLAIGAAVTLALLIACANVALLTLLRGVRRQKEIAVRLALGAGRWRIARMLLAESALLCAAAVTGAATLAVLVLRWLAPAIERQLGRRVPGGVSALSIDWTVLAVVGVSALLVTIALSLAPLLVAGRGPISATLRQGKQSGAQGVRGRRTRSALIALEVAGSLALLAGCGLMVRTIVRMLDVDLGIRPAGVVTASLAIRQQSYPSAERRAALYERLIDAARQGSGVASVAVADPPPLFAYQPRAIRGDVRDTTVPVSAAVRAITSDYFPTLGIPIVHGRAIADGDRNGSEPVAIVSESAARRLWGEGPPLGRTIRMVESGDSPSDTAVVVRTIVGVARDVRQSPSDDELVDVYIPLLQAPGRFVTIVARSSEPADSWLAELRRTMRSIDPEVTVGSVARLDDAVADQLARPRFLAALFAAFGSFAALLGIMGLYAVIAYAVKQREHEIAVRMAVGADARTIVALFMRDGSRVLAVGVALGVLGAVGIGRVLESQLFGVERVDVVTLVVAAIGLAGVALAAIWWPARRASRTDPVVALKAE